MLLLAKLVTKIMFQNVCLVLLDSTYLTRFAELVLLIVILVQILEVVLHLNQEQDKFQLLSMIQSILLFVILAVFLVRTRILQYVFHAKKDLLYLKVHKIKDNVFHVIPNAELANKTHSQHAHHVTVMLFILQVIV